MSLSVPAWVAEAAALPLAFAQVREDPAGPLTRIPGLRRTVVIGTGLYLAEILPPVPVVTRWRRGWHAQRVTYRVTSGVVEVVVVYRAFNERSHTRYGRPQPVLDWPDYVNALAADSAPTGDDVVDGRAARQGGDQ